MGDILDRIRNWCAIRDTSIPQIAKKTGIAQSTIYAWNKHNPSADKLQAIADALDITVAELTGKPDMESPQVGLLDDPKIVKVAKRMSGFSEARKETVVRVVEALEDEYPKAGR